MVFYRLRTSAETARVRMKVERGYIDLKSVVETVIERKAPPGSGLAIEGATA